MVKKKKGESELVKEREITRDHLIQSTVILQVSSFYNYPNSIDILLASTPQEGVLHAYL